MSSRWAPVRLMGSLCVAALMTAALTSASAQTPVSLTPRNAGPVDLADLQLLLGDGVYFQHFNFAADAAFCLSLSYTVDGTYNDIADGVVDGNQVSEQHGGRLGLLCHAAGEHRLLVVLRSGSLRGRESFRLHFGLHERDTGTGGAFSSDDDILPDGQVRAWSVETPREALMFDRDVPLLTWTFEQQTAMALPSREPITFRAELSISAHLEENPSGAISAGPDPNPGD